LRLGKDEIYAPEELRHADWEVYALREVRVHLQENEPEKALAVLAQRSERIAGSPLVPLEVDALRRLRQPEKALDICRAGLDKARTAENLQATLALHLLAAELGLELRNKNLLQYHAGQALRIANAVQSPPDELRALEVLARGELTEPKLSDDPTQNAMLDLERAFARVPPEALQQAPEIAGRVVKMLGLRSKVVLRKAATTFGNRPDQSLISNDSSQLAELLRQVEIRSGGDELLSNLAASLGLPRTDVDVDEIASNTIRYNRQGDALAAVLDAFGNDDKVRSYTAEMFA
jgi:hypothetical protein